MSRTPIAFATFVIAAATCTFAAFAAARTMQDPPMPQPTPEHKIVLEAVGKWEGTLTSYMMGDKPTPVPCKETIEPVGAFWTQSRFECQFMGMPYTGTGCVGYDPEKKKYIGTWIDSMSSHFAMMEGEYDAARKAMVMHWIAPDMTGKPAPHRSECVHTGDSMAMTFFSGSGEGTKSMVIEMKRVGAKPAAPATPK